MDDLNKGLMTFASYNAGPGRLRQLRRETEKRGLNPNVWFGNVERIASERIGRETVTYVSNIYKYYITYRLLADQQARRDAAKAEIAKAQVRRHDSDARLLARLGSRGAAVNSNPPSSLCPLGPELACLVRLLLT